jgi:hypothetical protein
LAENLATADVEMSTTDLVARSQEIAFLDKSCRHEYNYPGATEIRERG